MGKNNQGHIIEMQIQNFLGPLTICTWNTINAKRVTKAHNMQTYIPAEDSSSPHSAETLCPPGGQGREDLEQAEERRLSQELAISCSLAPQLCSPMELPLPGPGCCPARSGRATVVKLPCPVRRCCSTLVLRASPTGAQLSLTLPAWQKQESSLERFFVARIFTIPKPEYNNVLAK